MTGHVLRTKVELGGTNIEFVPAIAASEIKSCLHIVVHTTKMNGDKALRLVASSQLTLCIPLM
jgi:hypothetical protein